VIEIIQDKYRQKLFLSQAGIPVSDFEEIKAFPSSAEIKEQVQQVAGRLGFPLMLKSRLYPGVDSAILRLQADLSELKLYAERFVPFTCEIAVMVVKGVPVPGSSDPNICVYVLGHESGKKGSHQVKRCLELVSGLKGVSVEAYGKFSCQKGRKMAHINVVGESDADVRETVSMVVRCLPANQTEELNLASLSRTSDKAAGGGFSDSNP
ncbi:hypothetical protein VP01_11317g1, partial [Puccinia sorghi]